VPHSVDERATSLAARRILQSHEIRDFLKDGVMQGENGKRDPLAPTPVPHLGRPPGLVLAIDGSLQPVPVHDGFPGSEVAYFSFAAVLLDMELVDKLEAARPSNPAEFSKVRSVTPQVMVVPGRNFRQSQDNSPHACFRRVCFERLGSAGFDASTETLRDTYEALLAHRSEAKEPRCPYPMCATPQKGMMPRIGEASCGCNHTRRLYSTDWLRIHEGFNDIGENGAAYSEFMQVTERLWLLNLLRTLEKRNQLDILCKLAFVLDGPLAVFGHPAWIKDAFEIELMRLNALVREATGEDILLIGIEKTGQFVEHFLSLDRDARGTPHQIANGSLFLIDDHYIKRNIILSESERPYGYQTYFGRKFFYKTKTGAMIVGSVPFLRQGDNDIERADLEQFPRVSDALFLLDHLISSQFPNATVPLVEAHAQAAIARGLNAQILERLTKSTAGLAHAS
jgi:NurA domain